MTAFVQGNLNPAVSRMDVDNSSQAAILPFISVVMPVRNEAGSIRSTLEQVIGQNYPPDRFEIIVADGESTDSTPEIVQAMAQGTPCLRLVSNPARLSSAGRNAGFKLGRGDVFLVVDGHCHIPSKDLLAEVAKCFASSGADCLGRPQHLDPPGLSPFQKAVALARSSPLGHGQGSLIYGEHEGYCSPVSNGAAYRREVFEKVGYVDESFDACEDVEFNLRVEQAGLRCYTSPRLMVKYYPRESLGGLWRQMLRYGRGRFLLFRKHPATLSLSTLIPPLFVLGVSTCLVLSLSWALAGNGVAALAFLLPLMAYLLAVAFESLRISATKELGLAITLPGTFAVIHGGLGSGFLMAAWRAHFSRRNKQ